VGIWISTFLNRDRLFFEGRTFEFFMSGSDELPSDSESSDEITLPPDLLERDRQLWERNQQLEARVRDLLKTASIDEPPPPAPKSDVPSIQQRAKIRALPKADALPPARPSPTKRGIIEVEVPVNVEAVPEVKVDPVPELRQVFHKIAREIKSVNEQIAFIESNKTKCEVLIAKLQGELKRTQVDNERAQRTTTEITSQIESSEQLLADVKTKISAARLSRIERVQLESEAKQKQSQLDQKVRRTRAEADRLQNELNTMQSADARSAKMHSERLKLQQTIDDHKKAIRQLKIVISEIQRAAAHEEKIFDHIQNGRDLSLSSESIERAISELL
jgi:hypothetical protein